MIHFTYDNIDIKLYTDEYEFAKDYFKSDEAIVQDDLPKSTGFACDEENEIAIFVKVVEFNNLFATVAHELGHLTKCCIEVDDYDEQERKAIHYESFAVDVIKLTRMIINKYQRL